MEPLTLILILGGAFILLTMTNTGGLLSGSPGFIPGGGTKAANIAAGAGNPIAQQISAGGGNQTAQDISAASGAVGSLASLAKAIPWGSANTGNPQTTATPAGSTSPNDPLGGTQNSNNLTPVYNPPAQQLNPPDTSSFDMSTLGMTDQPSTPGTGTIAFTESDLGGNGV
jgi:hypothetical protein